MIETGAIQAVEGGSFALLGAVMMRAIDTVGTVLSARGAAIRGLQDEVDECKEDRAQLRAEVTGLKFQLAFLGKHLNVEIPVALATEGEQ